MAIDLRIYLLIDLQDLKRFTRLWAVEVYNYMFIISFMNT